MQVGEFTNQMYGARCISLTWLKKFRPGRTLEGPKNCGHGTQFGDFSTVCGHFLASKAGKDAIVAWPRDVFFLALKRCVGW